MAKILVQTDSGKTVEAFYFDSWQIGTAHTAEIKKALQIAIGADVMEQKGTPRWELATDDFCPRCASPVDLYIVANDEGEERVAKERCTSCEWTA